MGSVGSGEQFAQVRHTVLIVDDHAGFRSAARSALEIDGWEVVGEAADGAGGMAAARRLNPCLVLLDVGLPDTSGFEVAAQLARGGHGGAVVLTSSRDEADFGELARCCDVAGFLPKQELSGAALHALVHAA